LANLSDQRKELEQKVTKETKGDESSQVNPATFVTFVPFCSISPA